MDVDSMSIKQLKELIKSAGLRSDDCLEKSDLRKRALEAQERLKQARLNARQTPSSSREVRKLSCYDCIVSFDRSRKVDGAVLICHGFGASNTDFVPLIGPISARAGAEKNIAFIFPQAHASPMSMGASAWWQIDVMKWMGSMQMGEAGIAKLIREKPPGLDECRENMTRLIHDVHEMIQSSHEDNKSNRVPLVMGGFSQGSMTVLDTALHHEDEDTRVDHILMMSGAPIVVDEWTEKLKRNDKGKNMNVLITHGLSDAVLPYVASGWVRDLLQQHGADVKHQTHSGGHELGGHDVMEAICEFVVNSLTQEQKNEEVIDNVD